MSQIGAERLHHLANFLEFELKPTQFLITEWVSKMKHDKKNNVMVYDCGTVACAVGWAAQVPELRKAGFRIEPSAKSWGISGVPMYNHKRSWFAVTEFFDISDSDAHHLFSGYAYAEPNKKNITPKMVAERIRSFISNKWPEWEPTPTKSEIDYLALTRDIVKGS